MATFLIEYDDPETGERCKVEKDFEDSHDPHFISAAFWAEDCAYSLADKGWHSVKEVEYG